jgi:hypothetical protein
VTSPSLPAPRCAAAAETTTATAPATAEATAAADAAAETARMTPAAAVATETSNMPTSSHVSTATMPPVANAPPTRPNIERNTELPTNTATNRNGSSWNRPGTPCAGERAAGAGRGSPSITRSMRSTPAAMPP